jgi:YVTN family beta-propeller protein
MTRRVLVSLLLLATVAVAHAARPRLLLVGNKAEDTLSFVDADTRQVLATTTTGRGPHEVAATPDGRKAFVANYEGAGDSISVIDVEARKELRRIPTDPYRQPHGLAVSSDGRTLYATCEQNRAVIELDVATEKITRHFDTGQSVTHMIALTPDGKRAYTANIGSGTSSPINLETGTVGTPIPTGPGCEGIAATPDGRFVWTANNAAGTLSVIDTHTDKVVETIPCPGFPIRVKFTRDGARALVSRAVSNDLAVYNAVTRKLIKHVPTGSTPVGLLIDPDGKRAYIANTAADRVSILDLQTLKITGEITAGKTPDGLAFAAPD